MSYPKMKEKAVLFRLPERQIIILDNIVKHSQGRYKSRNDIMTEILDYFIEDLRVKAEKMAGNSHE
jgi:hypothetical protein